MKKSRSYIATPPGATIREQLEERVMNQKEFASRMDMSEKHISRLINGEVILTPDVAVRLEMVLGIPAHFWNNLESIYREKLVMVHIENEMEDDLEIVNKFPYKEMIHNGWIEDSDNMSGIVISLRKFFEVAKLTKLKEPLVPGIAYRRKSVTEMQNYILLVWAQKAKVEARSIETKQIDIQHLEKMLPSIRQIAMEEPVAISNRLCEMLSECGIALVFLPHIGDFFLHGATFFDKNKIVIGLVVMKNDAERFWFSLFHELAHILYGHIYNQDGTTEEEEMQADCFAKEMLITI